MYQGIGKCQIKICVAKVIYCSTLIWSKSCENIKLNLWVLWSPKFICFGIYNQIWQMYPRIGACQNIFLITNVFYYSYLIQSKSSEKIEQNMQVQRSLKYIFSVFRTKSGKCTKVQEHIRPKSLLSVLCTIQTSHKKKLVNDCFFLIRPNIHLPDQR